MGAQVLETVSWTCGALWAETALPPAAGCHLVEPHPSILWANPPTVVSSLKSLDVICTLVLDTDMRMYTCIIHDVAFLGSKYQLPILPLNLNFNYLKFCYFHIYVLVKLCSAWHIFLFIYYYTHVYRVSKKCPVNMNFTWVVQNWGR